MHMHALRICAIERCPRLVPHSETDQRLEYPVNGIDPGIVLLCGGSAVKPTALVCQVKYVGASYETLRRCGGTSLLSGLGCPAMAHKLARGRLEVLVFVTGGRGGAQVLVLQHVPGLTNWYVHTCHCTLWQHVTASSEQHQ